MNFKDKQTHAVEIKSASSDEFAPARTVRVQMEKEGTITVRLGQNNPFLGKKFSTKVVSTIRKGKIVYQKK